MGIAQMSALSGGQKYKRPYVDEINARKQYLPGMYAQKQENQYRDKMHSLDTQRLAQDKKFGMANLSLAEDAQKEAKKRNRTAKQMGYANIGLGAGMGVMNNWDAIKGGADSVTSMFPQVPSPSKLGIGTPESYSGSTVSGMSSPMDWASDNLLDPIKQFGGGLWDAGKGIYDSLVGDVFDTDWGGGMDDLYSII